MTTDNSRADALTEAQRKALETAVNVLNTNWEHETANELWEAFTAPSLQPAAAPKHWRDMPENIAILGVERGDSVECDGTFACPICGKGEPHEHSSAEVAQHHIDKQQPAPSPADERAAFEAWWTRDVPAEHKASAYALLKQFGDDYAANKRCAEAWEVWQARAASAIIDAGHAIPEHWRVKAEHIVSMDRDPAKREEAGKTAVMLLRVLLKDPHARAAASPAAAEAVAQWQTRVRDVILPENKRWVNVSEDGAKTVLEKYADTYEVRALYAAPPPAQADAREGLTADMRESVEHAATWLARSEDLQNKAHAERLRALLQGANHA